MTDTIQTFITWIPIVLLWVRTPIPQTAWAYLIPRVEIIRNPFLKWIGIEIIGLLDCVKCISFWLLFWITDDFILSVQGTLIAIGLDWILNRLEN
jgi:hypothetical protein